MNDNNDLPGGGKQVIMGDKKLTIIYYMDYSPLSNIIVCNFIFIYFNQQNKPTF
jgi:hypothetical protein